ncbi:MAG: carboxypeptidase-like regulatory domain-containing protein [Acidobacteria bacterium]|nr:carboxypeptidase-like regulatory domain-containing protein [Acidobacteriota bacterium]
MRGTVVRRLGSRVIACLVLSLAAAGTILRAATETGLLLGRVTRASTGAPLEQVPLRLLGSGVEFTVRSGDAGRFRFEQVPAGTYRLTADLPASASARPVEVTVAPRSETRADLIVILPEALADRITVVGARRAGGHEGVSTEIYDAATLRSRPGALDDPFRALTGAERHRPVARVGSAERHKVAWPITGLICASRTGARLHGDASSCTSI